jgi:hypothetical protein
VVHFENLEKSSQCGAFSTRFPEMRRTPPFVALLAVLLAAASPAAAAAPARTLRLVSSGGLAPNGAFADGITANGTAVFDSRGRSGSRPARAPMR